MRQNEIEAILLDRPEAIACQMFGTTGYLVQDRLIAFWHGGGLALKPPPERRTALLQAGQARELELRPGRPFGAWIVVPTESPLDFADLIPACRDFVLSQPPRPARRRRRLPRSRA